MKKDIHYIEKLVNRFFEGETTNREEQELYSFFSQPEIPSQLEQYKDVFHYFEEDILKELEGEEVKPLVSGNFIKTERWMLSIAAVAAVILLLVVTKTFLVSGPFDPFEGSYIVENGVKITDPELIREEIIETYEDAIEMERKLGEKLKDIEKYEDIHISSIYTREDPVQEILERYESEIIREEIQKLLELK